MALPMLMTALLSGRRRGPQPGQDRQWQLPPRPNESSDKRLLCLSRPAARSGSVWFRHTSHPLGLRDRLSPLFVTFPHGMPCGLMNIQAKAFDKLRNMELLYDKSHSCHSQSDWPVAATRF